MRIERINELARKSKTPEGLTDAEREEQRTLRAEYIAAFRESLRQQLDNMYILDENGKEQKITKRSEQVH